MLLLPNNTEVTTQPSLPPRFCAYFSLQILFLLVGAQKSFCPRAQGTLATPFFNGFVDAV